MIEHCRPGATLAMEHIAKMEMLLVSEPMLGSAEKSALCEVIEGGWITMGERVRALETAFAERHGVEEAVAVSSCTAALHLILHALGLGSGDEVLVPSLTFVATANSVLYVGAQPVFVEIEATDWPIMSLADAAAKCSPQTKAIILMHYGGYVANRESWREFAFARNLLIIEDAAHAAGADLAGSIGDASAFSFYGNKNMTTAEGGMIVAKDRSLLESMRQMRGHGLTSGTFQRFSSKSVGYDVTMLGYNYRMDELRAAIGLVQLANLDKWNERRRQLTSRYMRTLAERCEGVQAPFSEWSKTANHMSSHHIMPVVLPKHVDRRRVIELLKAGGVQTSVHYPAVHELSYYRSRYPDVSLPVTEAYAGRVLTLPLHPKMDDRDVDRVVALLATAVHETRGAGAGIAVQAA
jgi:dTDP-4-amino-4,6-dideoxygalactose transaminase